MNLKNENTNNEDDEFTLGLNQKFNSKNKN
jgi:hypothetical protein